MNMKAILCTLLCLFSFNSVSNKLQDTRKVVAVLDTGIDIKLLEENYMCKGGHVDYTESGMVDNMGHGNNIVGILAKEMDRTKYCLVMIKYWDASLSESSTPYLKALNYALTLAPEYLLFAGEGPTPLPNEKDILLKFKNVVVAAGNRGINLDETCVSYPTCYKLKNVVSVGSGTLSVSNKGKTVNVWMYHDVVCANKVCMTGTSQASALYLSQRLRK